MKAFNRVLDLPGGFRYVDGNDNVHAVEWRLFLVSEAWNAGCDMEDLADGFGAGKGTMGGDWSGIRDSSNIAAGKMFERALNFLFGNGKPVKLESNDPDSLKTNCETGYPLSQELYEIAKHVEQVVYRDAKMFGRSWDKSILSLAHNLKVWIYG